VSGRRQLSLVLLPLLSSAATACGSGGRAALAPTPGPAAATSSSRAVATTGSRPRARRAITLGRSVQGRPIDVWVRGNPAVRRRVLVIGCIHGNETAGIRVARDLINGGPPVHATLWIIPNLNPDGSAAGTRQNADGVDLNRNFPFGWRALGQRGDQQFSGPRALSEPESRIAYRLILRLRPAITIWFHQPEAVTDQSGGSASLERRYAAVSGLPLRRLPRYPGSATSWQDHRFPGATAFVVELPPGRPSPAATARYAHAVRVLADSRH
jgi:protein MpaA